MSNAQDSITEKLKVVLQGEPLRAISYGATAVLYIAVNAAASAGIGNIQPIGFDAALVAVAAAVASVTEIARRFVYSPITVDRIINEVKAYGTVDPADAPNV